MISSSIKHSQSGSILLALAGELPTAVFIRSLLPHHTLLVAADGAALDLRAMGIMPDVIIGDLDSLGAAQHAFQTEGIIVIEEPDQEHNDFEKALEWILEQGYNATTVIGTFGRMADHALNNTSILAKFVYRMRFTLRDEYSTVHVLNTHLELTTSPNDRVSLIPLPSARVTTKGLVWNLTDEVLAVGKREGSSNRAAGTVAYVDVVEGLLLVFHYSD